MQYQWNIFGHDKALSALEKHLGAGQLGHAILFVGPSGIGKFSIAKRLSQILQCGMEPACSTGRLCATCMQIEKGGHLDTIEIGDDGESIKIEQMREVIARLNMTSQSKYRILFIKNIGRLTDEAANSLLKMLEEPGANTHFFFTAEHLREVLPTIRSRMHLYQLKPPTRKALFGFLKERYPKLTQENFNQLELLSLGKPGLAITLLESPDVYETKREMFEAVREFCLGFSLAGGFARAKGFSDDPQAAREFLILATAYLRHLMFYGSHGEQEIACQLLPKVVETYGLLKKNVNTRLLLENLSLSLYH